MDSAAAAAAATLMGHSAFRTDETMLLKSLSKSNLCLIICVVIGPAKGVDSKHIKMHSKGREKSFTLEKLERAND